MRTSPCETVHASRSTARAHVEDGQGPSDALVREALHKQRRRRNVEDCLASAVEQPQADHRRGERRAAKASTQCHSAEQARNEAIAVDHFATGEIPSSSNHITNENLANQRKAN